jgi:arsenate reductase
MKTIWHNPRCSKSRTALNLLKDASVDVHVFHYLNESFTYEDLMSVIEKLSIPVIESLSAQTRKYFALQG